MTDANVLAAIQPEDLAILTGVSGSAVSHQLRFLRDRRLVTAQKSGRAVNYRVDDQHVAALFRAAEDQADHVRPGVPGHSHRLP